MNYRILVIDDMESIHEDFKKILTPAVNPTGQILEQMNTKLFDSVKQEKTLLPPFTIDFAFQGEEGVRLVRESIIKKTPYAITFVDVLMPPGEDGIETIHRIWNLDQDIQTVICTAYAKYSWEDLLRHFGNSDRLFVLKKPFDPMEIVQLATSLTKRWSLNQEIKEQIISLQKNPSKPAESMEQSLSKLNSSVSNLKQLNEKLKKKFREQ